MPSPEHHEIAEPRREANLAPRTEASRNETHHHILREAALARFLAGGRWRLVARWLGLAIFLFGAGLLAWVFWQALAGFQNFTQPDYLSLQLRRVQGDGASEAILSGIIVFGAEFLRVLYLLLLGFLASVIAGKGIQFFAASEAVIDEAVVGEVD